VKTVAVFKDDRCDYDGEKREHSRSEQRATNTSAPLQG
jgi:hypothetical protein